MKRYENLNEKREDLNIFNDYYQIQISPKQLRENLEFFEKVSYLKDIALLVIEKIKPKAKDKTQDKTEETKVKSKIIFRDTSKQFNAFKKTMEEFDAYIKHKKFNSKKKDDIKFIHEEINRLKQLKKSGATIVEVLDETTMQLKNFYSIDDYIKDLYMELNSRKSTELTRMQDFYDNLIYMELYILINPKLDVKKYMDEANKHFDLAGFVKAVKKDYINIYNYFDDKYKNENLLNKYLKELDLKDDSIYLASYNELKNSINFNIRSKVANNKQINLTVNYNRSSGIFIFTDYNDNSTKVYANKLAKIEKYVRNFKFIENPETFKHNTIKDYFR